MHEWQSALVSAVVAVASLRGLILAVLTHFRWHDQKLWREAAESRAAIVEDLKSELTAARGDVDEVRKAAVVELGKAVTDREVLTVRIEAMEAQLAQVQRQNYLPQRQLDDAEKRNHVQHHKP